MLLRPIAVLHLCDDQQFKVAPRLRRLVQDGRKRGRSGVGVPGAFSEPKLAALRACKLHLHNDRSASYVEMQEEAHHP